MLWCVKCVKNRFMLGHLHGKGTKRDDWNYDITNELTSIVSNTYKEIKRILRDSTTAIGQREMTVGGPDWTDPHPLIEFDKQQNGAWASIFKRDFGPKDNSNSNLQTMI